MKAIKYEHLIFIAIAKTFKKNKYKPKKKFHHIHIIIVRIIFLLIHS